MAPQDLLGPPEIHTITTAAPVTTTKKTTNTTPFRPPAIRIRPRMGFTENKSATYLSTGNHCLDFFFHVVPDTPKEQLTKRLELLWNYNPLTTLKLICNLRGVRGTGKSNKEGFYTAALWLHENHPKTLACNVKAIADFGYFKERFSTEFLKVLMFEKLRRKIGER
ncbi:hypothetical protein ACH5RR_031490 [Cinchona calisaya]|uniref:DUF2828 domain-containing protein n=1 Tax=Cinchona calisaya TaxID=153742 RepID=A0ABD2YGG5_9GENT